MRFLYLFLLALFVAAPAFAQEQRASAFFCIASDDAGHVYYHSDTFPADPAISTADYQKSYSTFLQAQGKVLPVSCTFTDRTSAIPGYLQNLRQQCSDCARFDVQRVAWQPTRLQESTPSKATYPTQPNLLEGQSACAGFTEANYRERALSGGVDVQLKTMCGQAFEYYTMYKRAIAQGYSESDANRTYAAHKGAAQNAISFYQNNKAD